MKIFNKLKQILFDEVTEEIPVITKSDERQEKEKVKKISSEPKKKRIEDDDEVIIEKIETPKREQKIELEDDLFDMPKLKEEAKEEVKKSTFTFPVFGDDEITSKRRERKEERQKDRSTRRERESREEEREKHDSVGYTNAFDYSYGKYKGDYKSNREQSRELLTKTLEQKEEHKVFTPSPIISPVYGVLNENYKKEDIVTKKENEKPSEVLDLDSVRRKAYGTLEDEIEVSLSKNLEEEVPDQEIETGYEENEDEGISIDDLLVDSNSLPEDDEILNGIEEVEHEDDNTSGEEGDLLDDIIPVLDADDEEEKIESTPSKEKNKAKVEKEKTSEEDLGEEDLFDLIESIYEGKEEEE